MTPDILSIPAILDDLDAAESAQPRPKFQWFTAHIIATKDGGTCVIPRSNTMRVFPPRYAGYRPQGGRGSAEYWFRREWMLMTLKALKLAKIEQAMIAREKQRRAEALARFKQMALIHKGEMK